jgi:hypothetical protein
MNAEIENAVPLLYQRIIVPATRRVQIYIRHDDAHGTRALCEVIGPATISCVEIERDK